MCLIAQFVSYLLSNTRCGSTVCCMIDSLNFTFLQCLENINLISVCHKYNSKLLLEMQCSA